MPTNIARTTYLSNRNFYGDWYDPRQVKKHERKMFSPVYDAWNEGQAAFYKKGARNPYPPGRRHDEWQRGYDAEKQNSHAKSLELI